MASGLKLIKYPKIRLGIVADTSKTLTIQGYPRVELVIIAADVVATSTSRPLFMTTNTNFFGS